MARRGRLPKGMPPDTSTILEMMALWNQALAAPHGIKIRSDNCYNLSNQLYKARRECGHLAYGGLKVSYDETHVWIVPRDE